MRLVCLAVVALCACGLSSQTMSDGGASCSPSGPNLIANAGFDCGLGPFQGIFGSFDIVPNEGRNGSMAGRLTVGGAGARFALEQPIAVSSTPQTFCFSGFFKGNAPFMRLSLEPEGSSNLGRQFAAPIDPGWARVPPTIHLQVSNIVNVSKLFLLVEVQTGRPDGMNGQVGQVLYADDFDLWRSASGRCDDRR